MQPTEDSLTLTLGTGEQIIRADLARSLSRAIVRSPSDVDETIVRVLREEFSRSSAIRPH